ncbi:MAG: bifunctional nuclease family protein [Treponema sp.]|jgi:bifunctional DNase/RNase|nr:bifunctional nuclease family protein [Treponema sp.]
MQQFEKAEIWFIKRQPGGGAVFLQPDASDYVVPVFIDQAEFHTIKACSGKKDAARPLTYDLIRVLLETCGLRLFRIELKVRGGLFHARLFISGSVNGRDYTEDAPLALDARPADALALAVRDNYPLYIPARLIDTNGVPMSYIMNNGSTDDDALYNYRDGGSFSQEPEAGTGTDGLQPEKEEGPLTEETLLHRELDQAIALEEYERAAKIRDRLNLLNQKPD